MEVDATKRRTEITIETQRVLVVSGHRRVSVVSWCDACGWRVRMAKPEVAAAWAGVSARLIYRWLEAAQLHFAERPNGVLLVCLVSLSELLAGARGDASDGRAGKMPAHEGSHED
jgi:hypothetical protein